MQEQQDKMWPTFRDVTTRLLQVVDYSISD